MDKITRADALTSGLKRYFTGRACKRGHVAERRSSDRMCMECLRLRSAKERIDRPEYYAAYRDQNCDKAAAYNRAYYAERADKMREDKRAYRVTNLEIVRERDRLRHNSEARVSARKRSNKKHREKILERSRRRYQRDHHRIKEAVARYRAANPDKVREQRRPGVSAARARKKAAEGKFTKADVRCLFDQQGGVCAACPSELGCNYHVDHMTPLSRGGSNWPSNLQLLCQPCNLSKGKKTMAEWVAWKAEVALAAIRPDRSRTPGPAGRSRPQRPRSAPAPRS